MIIPPQEVQDEIRRRVGLLPDETWAYLRTKGFVARMQSGEMTIPQGAELVRRIFKAAGREVGTPVGDQPRFIDRDGSPSHPAPEKGGHSLRRSPNADLRQEAVSRLLAEQAAEDESLKAFRASHLADGLLPWERVESWIERQADLDGPASTWLQAALPDESLLRGDPWPYPEPAMEISKESPASGFTRRNLRYAVPDSVWTRSVLIREGGVLDRLANLSKRLSKRYRWLDAAAAVFTLTGRIPVVDQIKLEIHVWQDPGASSRIELHVDPTVKPAELAAHYAEARQRLVSPKYRTLSKKHLTLAIFSTKRPQGEKLKDQMLAWNSEHGHEWRYKEVTNFGRDVRQARHRLTEPTWFQRAIAKSDAAHPSPTGD